MTNGTQRAEAPVGVRAVDTGTHALKRILLRVVSGPDRGREALLEGRPVLVGAHADCDLVLTDPTVSRQHAQLSLMPSGVRIRDLGSTNGTFVGTSRVEGAVVMPGVELRVGKTRIELLVADAPIPEAPSQRVRFGKLVGESSVMRRLFTVLERAAQSDVSLVIEGEAGAGKSEAARAVHDASSRAEATFAVLDLAGAHAADALSSMLDARPCPVAGGTLVVDRVDEAAGAALGALRTALERRERGELDVRFIATSRLDLRALVEGGSFPRDLWFHLASIRTVVPPLRERREDVPRLVRDLAEALGVPDMTLSPEELAPLHAHPFPGNVRELARTIEHVLSRDRTSQAPPGPADPRIPTGLVALPFKEAKDRLVDAFERAYLADLLARHEGNLSRAAQDAGLDRNHLARLAKRHGIR